MKIQVKYVPSEHKLRVFKSDVKAHTYDLWVITKGTWQEAINNIPF